jgi:CotS family spore coat protein
MKKINEYINFKQNKNDFDTLYLDYADACIKDGEDAIAMLSETQYDKLVDKARIDKGFIHHDFAHHNILQSFKGTTYVVDFDFCVCDIRIHDLGSLIIRNMKKCNWDVDKALYIIDCYNNKSSIETSELEVLVPFFLFPQDFWQISRQYYIERKNWDEEDYLEKMNKKSEYTDMRRRFIDEFINKI